MMGPPAQCLEGPQDESYNLELYYMGGSASVKKDGMKEESTR